MGSGNNFGLSKGNTFTKYALILNPDIICDKELSLSNIQKLFNKEILIFHIIGTQYKDDIKYL